MVGVRGYIGTYAETSPEIQSISHTLYHTHLNVVFLIKIKIILAKKMRSMDKQSNKVTKQDNNAPNFFSSDQVSTVLQSRL